MTQKEWVLRQLKAGHSLTPKDALDGYGIMRLADIIWKLRKKEGYDIETEEITVMNRFHKPCIVARYRLLPATMLFA